MNTPLATDPARRARLNAIKLSALVRDHVGGAADTPAGESVEYPGGAALLCSGNEGWVLLDPPAGAVISVSRCAAGSA